jgi:hypothetical protein
MYRFAEVMYNPGSQTAGLVWDDVYAALELHGVNIVGGRTTEVPVGVAWVFSNIQDSTMKS